MRRQISSKPPTLTELQDISAQKNVLLIITAVITSNPIIVKMQRASLNK
jgi:hypothetical protein